MEPLPLLFSIASGLVTAVVGNGVLGRLLRDALLRALPGAKPTPVEDASQKLREAIGQSEAAARELADDIDAKLKTRDELASEIERNQALAEATEGARRAMEQSIRTELTKQSKSGRRLFWYGQLMGFFVGVAASVVASFVYKWLTER